MRGKMIWAAIGLFVGCLIGILVQRFFPIGTILQQLGLRQLLPIDPNVPTANLVSPDWDIPLEDRGSLLLFVLIGQSNMSGRGSLESPLVPEPHPSVFMFNKDYRWYPAQEPLGSMPSEVDWVASDGGTGVGPGLALARAVLAQRPGLKIGLIPCARGSSSIADWEPDTGQNTLYGACLKRIRAASSYGTVAAVLISQGEDDTLAPELFPDRVFSPNSWGAEFTSLVEALRHDLGQPQLPVIFSQLPEHSEDRRPNWEVVREQQGQVSLPNVHMIRVDDIPLEDGVHFGTQGQVEIGRRFAEAYLRLVATQP